MSVLQDFTPTTETISLHGLGFIQVKLPANKRLHVWHPELPRRDCFEHSAIHNHRFSFRSTVLIGTQFNQRADLIIHPEGTHTVISHDGPRSERGGRLSFAAGRVNVRLREMEKYKAGESYIMPELEYHHTPQSFSHGRRELVPPRITVTLMEKLSEGAIHACSVIKNPHEFHQDFNRFQLSAEELWRFVVDALGSRP